MHTLKIFTKIDGKLAKWVLDQDMTESYSYLQGITDVKNSLSKTHTCPVLALIEPEPLELKLA